MATTYEVLFLGNIAALDPTEGNTVSENAASIVGTTFGSAGDPLAFGSQQVMSPVDTSSVDPNAYDKDNTVANDTFSIDGGPAQTFDTVVIYNVTIHYTDGTPDATASVSLIQDTAGNLYLAPEYSAGPDVTALGAARIESITINSINADASWFYADRVATDFVCFANGTLILTALGAIPVEHLQPGDLVVTADHGLQPLRWTHRSSHTWDRAAQDGKPILIGRGALGMGLPRVDLVGSPQHRILVPHPEHAKGALVPAKALTHLPKVRQMQGRRSVTYVHLLFDHHEVIFAEGLPTESFFPGEMALRSLKDEDRKLVRRIILRNSTEGAGYAPARPFPPPGQMKRVGGISAPVWTKAQLTDAGAAIAALMCQKVMHRPKGAQHRHRAAQHQTQAGT